MKKLLTIFILFMVAGLAPKTTKAVSADSLVVINKNDSSITFVGYYSSNSIINSVLYKVSDSVNYWSYGPYNFFAGSFSDTITAVLLPPGMPISITMYVSDFGSVDSLTILDTTLLNPTVPATVNNLQITNVLQTGGTISADYDAGGSLMVLQFWYSTDSINWNPWSIYPLYGSGTQSFFYAQAPGTKTYWIALGSNYLNLVLDSSNIGILQTLPTSASAPDVDSLFVSNITQNSGYVDFDLSVDSIILTICTVQSSSDPSFNTGIWSDSSFVQSSGTMHYSVKIEGNGGYPSGTNVYVRVCAYNIVGSDTLFTTFLTTPVQVLPPSAVLNPYSNLTQSSITMSCSYDFGLANVGFIGFEIAYANDTNVLYWNSGIDTLYTSTGIFARNISGLYSNTTYAGRAFVFSSGGIYFTPFVNFTTSGFTSVVDVINDKNNFSSVEIYSIDGRLIYRNYNDMNVGNLPKGVYLFKLKDKKGNYFFRKYMLQ